MEFSSIEKKNKLNNKFAGSILILFSLYEICRNLYTIYEYRAYPEINRIIWIPEWILFVQAIIGLAGVVIGYRIFTNKLTIKKGVLTFVLLWIIGIGTEFIVISG